MKKTKKEDKKLYAYVDESGQDTKGVIFIVSILVIEKERDIILEKLEKNEVESNKKNLKWNKSRPQFRENYIENLFKIRELKGKIFFDKFSDTGKYIDLTSYATAKAILKKVKGDYRATIFVDGFRKKEIEIFSRGLRDLHIKTKKIRGVKKDENNAYIRLVDSICGLIRDAQDGNDWAIKVSNKLMKKNILTSL